MREMWIYSIFPALIAIVIENDGSVFQDIDQALVSHTGDVWFFWYPVLDNDIELEIAKRFETSSW